MRSILLVDDDASSRVVLAALLEDEGFAVTSAGSAAEVRQRTAADGAFYDVVLLDERLGDGLGTDLVPALRSRWPQARIVLLSGIIDAAEVTPGGLDALAMKGIPFPDLLAILGPGVPGRSLVREAE